MKILVTGAAGFIGFHVSKCLLQRDDEVIGFDSINDYYEVSLKYARLADLGINQSEIGSHFAHSNLFSAFRFVKGNLLNHDLVESLFMEEKFDAVCHFAAQPGVRYSLVNPSAYTTSNVDGFLAILEACRKFPVYHLVYASSSSVYGLNEKVPFSVRDNVDHPASLYAATKKCNELMSHAYSHLFRLPTTGLRFFTVYGPWGRPDMAPIIFSRAILEGEPIKVFNHGRMERDFTYIDDIVKGVIAVLDNPPQDETYRPGITVANPPYQVFNIGNGQPTKIMRFVGLLEEFLERDAICEYLPLQPGDVIKTWADTASLEEAINYRPKIPLEEGIKKFVDWFLNYESKCI